MTPLNTKDLRQRLVDSELIPADAFEKAVTDAEGAGGSLLDLILERNLITDEHLGEVVADLYRVPFVNLRKVDVDDDVLRIVPEVVARSQGVLAFSRGPEGVKLAMVDPSNREFVHFLEKKTGDRVIVHYATPADFREALTHYRKGIAAEFSQLLRSAEPTKGRRGKKKELGGLSELPVVKMVDTILAYAYENNASDVHVEPMEEKIAVRFRIDGILHDVVDLPKTLHDPFVTRVKILARLRTDEHAAAQDGRFEAPMEKEKVDIRVSIVPISDGEKVVMRLLSERSRRFSLESLGFGETDLEKLRRSIAKPYGMILATGPTGSGKTTTLYAILKILNTREVNISTIEDPVEYDIEGVNQIQVNPQTNLTFAEGLRSILRQDPDIIMVGEVRDEDTAGIAINSAMTGHLVLSSLHTNDAATTLPRLLDMRVEPFLIASTVNVAIGQRLVRKIHSACIESYVPKQAEVDAIVKLFGKERSQKLGLLKKPLRFYQGKGCALCNRTGYEGRIGIFEVMEIDEDLRKLIMKRASSDDIRKAAVVHGMTTMLEDGMRKVLKGVTTVEEVLRVTRE